MRPMRYALSFALVLLPLTALAGTVNAPVIGGGASPAGKWPDAAALYFGGQQGCSGTLIAPTVVLTAGHCVIDGRPGTAMVGAVDENNPVGGEKISVIQAYEYPSSQSTVDAAVLILQKPAAVTPRAIASGWAAFDIKNGASVDLVGFGATDRDANIDSPILMEATTTITDANCTASSGCNAAARPNGELGAGGMGIDTCPGDSGGPLYLTTPYGNFVAGITSRGYNDNNYYCSEGGIYERADKVVDWIEETTGLRVTRGPEPRGELITAVRGTPGETQIEANDPKTEDHVYAIATQPQYGVAAISDRGVLRVCPNKDVVGGDNVKVTVTDAADPTRTITINVGVLIEDGDPDDDCDPMAFGDDGGGGGCCDTRRSASGALPLALFVAFGLRRRRRAR